MESIPSDSPPVNLIEQVNSLAVECADLAKRIAALHPLLDMPDQWDVERAGSAVLQGKSRLYRLRFNLEEAKKAGAA